MNMNASMHTDPYTHKHIHIHIHTYTYILPARFFSPFSYSFTHSLTGTTLRPGFCFSRE